MDQTTSELVFRLAGTLAMSGWLALLLGPIWRRGAQAWAGVAVPVLLAVLYVGLMLSFFAAAPGGYGTLADVALLFGQTPILLAGWVHYLAFDLLIGAWLARRAYRTGMPHIVLVPILGLTLLFGPVGYLVFLLVKALQTSAKHPVWTSWALFSTDRALAVAALGFLALLFPTLAAYGFDQRTLDGTSIWTKPLKFELSIAIYLATLALYRPLAGPTFRASWPGRFVVWGAIAPAIFEIAYIALQAARGEASHFNQSTPLSAAMFALMGIGAVTMTLASPVLAYGIVRSGRPLTSLRLAIVLALGLTFALGGVEGMIMASHGSHIVGVAAVDQHLLLVGWSRTVGDLRVAHFLGLHVQQILPLFALAAGLIWATRQRVAVVAFAMVYTALTLAVLAQALTGRPIWLA